MNVDESLLATAQHIELIQAKIDALIERRNEALNQLVGMFGDNWPNGVSTATLRRLDEVLPAVNEVGDSPLQQALGLYGHEWRRLVTYGKWDEGQTFGRGGFPIGLDWPTPERKVPCVYALLGHNNEVVYVGRSESIKSRLRDHYQDPRKRPYLAGWEVHVCRTSQQMEDLEAILIEQHNPMLNVRREKRTGVAA